MSRILVCPRCHQPTAAPKKGGPKSVVRCPLCREQFKLRDAREFTPPRLLVISRVGDDSPPADEPTYGFADEELETTVAATVADEEFGLSPGVGTPPDAPQPEPVAPVEVPVESAPPELAEETIDQWLPPAAVKEPVAAAPGGPADDEPSSLTFEESSLTARPRTRRPKTNPLQELVKIVLGGVFGLCVGYAILVWGFRVDPFGLTKVLPQAIVPANLQQP